MQFAILLLGTKVLRKQTFAPYFDTKKTNNIKKKKQKKKEIKYMDQGPNQINMPFDFVFSWQMPNRNIIYINLQSIIYLGVCSSHRKKLPQQNIVG